MSPARSGNGTADSSGVKAPTRRGGAASSGVKAPARRSAADASGAKASARRSAADSSGAKASARRNPADASGVKASARRSATTSSGVKASGRGGETILSGMQSSARNGGAEAPHSAVAPHGAAAPLATVGRARVTPEKVFDSRVGSRAVGVDVESLQRVARRLSADAPSPAAAIDATSAMDAVLPARSIALELIAGRGHYDRVIAAVREAHTSVWIATANVKALMIEDSRAAPGRRRSMRRSAYVSIVALLDELAARGVELRLLHSELPSGPFRAELANRPRLLAGGLALARCPRVHMKAVIVDGELLYLGSANWTGAGLGAKGSGRRNFELGIVTDDVDLLDQVQALYERVWSGGECGACKLRAICPGPLSELRNQSFNPNFLAPRKRPPASRSDKRTARASTGSARGPSRRTRKPASRRRTAPSSGPDN